MDCMTSIARVCCTNSELLPMFILYAPLHIAVHVLLRVFGLMCSNEGWAAKSAYYVTVDVRRFT